MLDPRNISDCVAAAFTASKSMQGLSIELIDALTRFSGKDMLEISRSCPFEFAELNRLLREARNQVAMVQGLAAESASLGAE